MTWVRRTFNNLSDMQAALTAVKKTNAPTIQQSDLDDITPSLPINETREPKILSAEYGDGYIERTPDGLNADRKNYTLRWDVLTRFQRIILSSFFEYHEGVHYFYWVHPFEEAIKAELKKRPTPFTYEPERLKILCKSWGVEESDNGVYCSITAEFMQVFDV